MKFHKQLTSLVALALLTALVPHQAIAQQSHQEKPKVQVIAAEAMRIAPSIEVPGTVVSRNDAQIASEVAGRVAWVADEGARLEVGDVIARLDDRALKLDLAEAEANIKSLKADFEYQARETGRLKELAAGGNIPKSRLDQTLSRRDMLRQSLVVAEIRRDRIAYNLERSEVKAPFPGHVVARLVQIGEFTSPGQAVARFVDTENLEIRAQVPVAAAPFIAADQIVEVRHEGEVLPMAIRAVIPVGDERSRTFEIRVKLKTNTWIVGSAIRLSVPNGEARDVIAAPRDALIIRASGVSLFKINAENKAERVQISTGAGRADFVTVEGPVAAGDRLVVRGGEFLTPGQEVEILEVVS